MQGELAPLFFSYSRADAEFVLNLARDLRSAGVSLWIDQLDIAGGDRWDRAVEEALGASPCLLVILSPASVASQNVMDEVSFALERNKKVVPVLYRPCDIPFRLRRLQYIDFTVDYTNGLSQLLKALNIRPPSSVKPDPQTIQNEPEGESRVPTSDSDEKRKSFAPAGSLVDVQKNTETTKPEAPLIASPAIAQSPRKYSLKLLLLVIFLFAAMGVTGFFLLSRVNEKAEVNPKRDEEGPTSPSPSAKDSVSSGDRYNVTPCKSIEDSKTQLEWFVGPDKTMSWDEAKTWIGSLTDCGGKWQMPTIEQLATLYDSRFTAGTGFSQGGRNWPAHIHPVFASIGGGSWAWSREARDSRTARSFNFNQGVATEYEKDSKSYTTRAFAVRTSQREQK